MSYRQAVTPDRLRGRMNATIRSMNWGMVAVGASLGGVLADQVSYRFALWIGLSGAVVQAVALALSRTRRGPFCRRTRSLDNWPDTTRRSSRYRGGQGLNSSRAGWHLCPGRPGAGEAVRVVAGLDDVPTEGQTADECRAERRIGERLTGACAPRETRGGSARIRGGRRRCDDRAVLAAVIFVATSGCTWRQCRPSSVRPGKRCIAASPTGPRPGYGPSCTAWCSTGSARTANWTGLGVRSTRSVSARSKGALDRTESDRSRQAGIKDPRHL